MHHLLRLLATQPDLLVEHVNAYAELVCTDAKSMSAAVQRTARWHAAFLCCESVGAALAGVALMLWASMPGGAIQAPWVLVATPLVPLLAGVACLRVSRHRVDAPAFANVRQQIAADAQMLREAGPP